MGDGVGCRAALLLCASRDARVAFTTAGFVVCDPDGLRHVMGVVSDPAVSDGAALRWQERVASAADLVESREMTWPEVFVEWEDRANGLSWDVVLFSFDELGDLPFEEVGELFWSVLQQLPETPTVVRMPERYSALGWEAITRRIAEAHNGR